MPTRTWEREETIRTSVFSGECECTTSIIVVATSSSSSSCRQTIEEEWRWLIIWLTWLEMNLGRGTPLLRHPVPSLLLLYYSPAGTEIPRRAQTAWIKTWSYRPASSVSKQRRQKQKSLDIHVIQGNPATIICKPILTTKLIIYVGAAYTVLTSSCDGLQ